MRLHQPFCAQIVTITAAVVAMSASAFGQQVSASGQASPLSRAVEAAAKSAAQDPGEVVRRI